MKTPDKNSISIYAIRQRKSRDSLRNQGFVFKQVAVHPDDWPSIHKIIRKAFVKRKGDKP